VCITKKNTSNIYQSFIEENYIIQQGVEIKGISSENAAVPIPIVKLSKVLEAPEHMAVIISNVANKFAKAAQNSDSVLMENFNSSANRLYKETSSLKEGVKTWIDDINYEINKLSDTLDALKKGNKTPRDREAMKIIISGLVQKKKLRTDLLNCFSNLSTCTSLVQHIESNMLQQIDPLYNTYLRSKRKIYVNLNEK